MNVAPFHEQDPFFEELPRDLDAERGVVGGVLGSGDVDPAGDLELSDLWDERHRLTLDAARQLDQDGEPVNILTVKDQLDRNGELGKAGGVAFVASLPDGVPTGPASIRAVAAIVARKARQRARIELLHRGLEDQRNGASRWPGILEELNAAQGPAEKAITPLDLTADPRPLPQLVAGVIPAGGRLLVAAPSNVGKTWLALDLALAAVTGDPWLGLEEHRIAGNKGPAVLVDEESPAGLLRHRLARLAQGRGLDLAAPELAERLVVFAQQGIAIGDAKRWGALVAEVRRLKPCLVVLDPAIRMLTGSDSTAEDVAAFWRAVGELQRAGGGETAALVVHHSGWVEKDRPRGSTDWRGGTDVELSLSRGESRDRVRVTWRKVRDGEWPAPMWVGLEFDPNAVRLTHGGSAEERERMTTQELKTALLSFLALAPEGSRLRSEALVEFCPDGSGSRNLDRAVKELKKEQKICSRDGGYALL